MPSKMGGETNASTIIKLEIQRRKSIRVNKVMMNVAKMNNPVILVWAELNDNLPSSSQIGG
jgi:hypothetical protein